MTDMYKRTWFRAAALGVVAAALMVGCGKKEEPKPAPVAEAPKAEPLKIAFAYVGPVGDGGWTFAHDNARKALEAEFGDKIKTSFTENVSESADAERNFRDMSAKATNSFLAPPLATWNLCSKWLLTLRTSSSSMPLVSSKQRTCALTTAAPMKARTWLA
jgi:hypothetical protein